MPLIRVLLGLLSLAAAALLLNVAVQRLMTGLALLFGGAIAFAAGALLVGSAAWAFVRRRRDRRSRGQEPAQRVVLEEALAFD